MATELTKLFSPYRMKKLTIKNRFVRSPMESSLGFEDGLVTNDHLRFYKFAAQGGVGLMMVEGISVSKISKMTDHMMVAYSDANIPGFKKLTREIHAHGDGVVAWAQLYCGGSASWGYSYGQNDYGLDVNKFTVKEIEDIVDSYANASLILKKGGFDGVEIHGAHGYIVSQFLSSAVNHRTDEWGADREGRMRFPLEILRRIREKCGDDFPVGIKLNMADFLPGGNWLDDTKQIAAAFAKAGFDLIEASGGMGFMTELREALREKMGNHNYYFKDCIPALKEALEGFNTALCVTGGIGDPEEMEKMLGDGVDFIGLARPWLAEPDFANRVKAGDRRPTRCVSREHICNLCLTRLALGPVTCYKLFPGYCKMECPIDQDTPDYIGYIARGEFEEAFKTILRQNPMPFALCNICDHPCESVCRGKSGEPLAIRDLKRFAIEYGRKNGLFEKIVPPNAAEGEKVAIIGAGPAGLACAFDLAKSGYRPVVFEKGEKAGGALCAIPRFRMEEAALKSDLDYIKSFGVELKCGMEAGKAFTIEGLFKEGYKAVFIATGAGLPVKLSAKGCDLKGVHYALPYLESINKGETFALGGKTLVLGGGSVAVDAAMTARKTGCDDVTLVSLEQRDEMPAADWEIDDALESGVKIINGYGLEHIDGTDKVASVKLVRCTRVFDKDGRFAPEYDSGETKDLQADSVILAVGQKSDLSWIEPSLGDKIIEGGRVKADELTLQTAVPGVFAAGDVQTGPKTAVKAVGAGKEAAVSIDRFIRGVSMIRTPKSERYDPYFVGAAAYAEISKELKKKNKPLRPVLDESGIMTEAQAIAEARRCLKYDVELAAESAARYANMGEAQIDFRKLSGEKWA